MHPLPVPMSRMRKGRSFEGTEWAQTLLTSHSVSGRGIRTPLRTLNFSPANHAHPNTYCIGSPCSRRFTAASIHCLSASERVSTAPQMMSVNESPNFSSTSIRATARASRWSYTPASRRQMSSYVISIASSEVYYYIIMYIKARSNQYKSM